MKWCEMGTTSLYFFVNKWNRFQDTSMLQKRLVWLSCVRGGGGAGVMYVARSCYHGCGIFSIGMSHPVHVRPTVSQLYIMIM